MNKEYSPDNQFNLSIEAQRLMKNSFMRVDAPKPWVSAQAWSNFSLLLA